MEFIHFSNYFVFYPLKREPKRLGQAVKSELCKLRYENNDNKLLGGSAIFTLHLFYIIGHPIDDDLSFKLKANRNDNLIQKKTSYQEMNDDFSENVDKLLQTVSRDVSAMLDNSSTSKNLLCQINNIYVISNFNASAVKVGESSFRKYPKTNKNKKSQNKKSKERECNTSEVKSTKIGRPEYLEKAENTGKSTFISNFPAFIQTTEYNLDITYHYPSKTNV